MDQTKFPNQTGNADSQDREIEQPKENVLKLYAMSMDSELVFYNRFKCVREVYLFQNLKCLNGLCHEDIEVWLGQFCAVVIT